MQAVTHWFLLATDRPEQPDHTAAIGQSPENREYNNPSFVHKKNPAQTETCRVAIVHFLDILKPQTLTTFFFLSSPAQQGNGPPAHGGGGRRAKSMPAPTPPCCRSGQPGSDPLTERYPLATVGWAWGLGYWCGVSGYGCWWWRGGGG